MPQTDVTTPLPGVYWNDWYRPPTYLPMPVSNERIFGSSDYHHVAEALLDMDYEARESILRMMDRRHVAEVAVQLAYLIDQSREQADD